MPDAALVATVEAALRDADAGAPRITDTRPATGGCIAASYFLTLSDGRRLFLKTHRHDGPADLFRAEHEALRRLAAAGAIRVPTPLAVGDRFIVMEAFRAGDKGAGWQETFGRQLAELHLNTRAQRYGFAADNYLGASPQPNAWRDDWVSFWRHHRLGWQLRLFADRGTGDDPLLRLGERLLSRLDGLLAQPDEPPVLLHGDLWSGNAAADETGRPVIFDPASYYGRREAEFGIMRLFGGFGARCEAAYGEVWPLADGADRRIACYRLYHELNHLNLFGGGYYASCLATLRGLVG